VFKSESVPSKVIWSVSIQSICHGATGLLCRGQICIYINAGQKVYNGGREEEGEQHKRRIGACLFGVRRLLDVACV